MARGGEKPKGGGGKKPPGDGDGPRDRGKERKGREPEKERGKGKPPREERKRPVDLAEVARLMGLGPGDHVTFADRAKGGLVKASVRSLRAAQGKLARKEPRPPDSAVERAKRILAAEGKRLARIPYPEPSARIDVAVETGEDVESDEAFDALDEALRAKDLDAALHDVFRRYPAVEAAFRRKAEEAFREDARAWIESLGLPIREGGEGAAEEDEEL